MSARPPRLFFELGIITVLLALLPLFWIARGRVTQSPLPRMHVVPDMDNAISYKRQEANPLFADGRAMRAPVEGTVARGRLMDDEHYYTGIVDNTWASSFPEAVTLDRAFLDRGRERYEIYCTPCHGVSGYGNGPVARRADALLQATWVPPSSMHDDLVRSRTPGHLFNSITQGVRTMPAYGSAVPVDDRWAIVGYIRALQRSQHATIDDVPEGSRVELDR
jgi:mono/diheme cytochrome c family protein